MAIRVDLPLLQAASVSGESEPALIDLCIEKGGQVEIIMQVGVYFVVSCQISNFGRVNAQRTITSAFLFARSSSKIELLPIGNSCINRCV